MKKISSITAILFTLLLTGCSKKDVTPSKKDLLTSGSWKLTALMTDDDDNGSYETDEYALFPDCYKDNYYTFMANGEVEFNEGLAKCDPGDPQTTSFNWQLTQNETHIVIDGDEFILEDLTTASFKWKEETPGGGSLFTFTKR